MVVQRKCILILQWKIGNTKCIVKFECITVVEIHIIPWPFRTKHLSFRTHGTLWAKYIYRFTPHELNTCLLLCFSTHNIRLINQCIKRNNYLQRAFLVINSCFYQKMQWKGTQANNWPMKEAMNKSIQLTFIILLNKALPCSNNTQVRWVSLVTCF